MGLFAAGANGGLLGLMGLFFFFELDLERILNSYSTYLHGNITHHVHATTKREKSTQQWPPFISEPWEMLTSPTHNICGCRKSAVPLPRVYLLLPRAAAAAANRHKVLWTIEDLGAARRHHPQWKGWVCLQTGFSALLPPPTHRGRSWQPPPGQPILRVHVSSSVCSARVHKPFNTPPFRVDAATLPSPHSPPRVDPTSSVGAKLCVGG